MRCEKVLITGATGLLGSAVVEAFRMRGCSEIIGRGRHELDITDEEQVRDFIDGFRPDLIVNCAAYTRVDDCETGEAYAHRVNGDGAGYVARAARACNAELIHVSTDYVFNGHANAPIREDSPPGLPEHLSAYGRSKLRGEQCVREAHPDAVVIRTAWLFGREGTSFPKAILNRAREGLPLRVVNDQVGSPTYAKDLADAIWELAQYRAKGTYHFTNRGSCTWHDLAGEVLRHAGIIANIEAVTSEELGRPARRPKYSVLDMSRFITETGSTPRPWQDALEEFLRT
ncbi:MAG: dTDP-4-dehydrorhamnose reductase [Phycisphaerae bacterium]|nr:dTDP-4-dehydrorhamnose reductase [Phycisphaerae bacterium]